MRRQATCFSTPAGQAGSGRRQGPPPIRLAVVALLTLSTFLALTDAAPVGPDKKRPPHFTIGKDTTRVTEPVDKDGFIDYVAALNKRLQQGVTPDNNANVHLWQAFGPHPQGASVPPEFFQGLGMAVPPDKGEYFIDLFKYLVVHLKVNLQKADEDSAALLVRTRQRPWTAKEFPEAAGWLKQNEKSLALAIEASNGSRYYASLVPPAARMAVPLCCRRRISPWAGTARQATPWPHAPC